MAYLLVFKDLAELKESRKDQLVLGFALNMQGASDRVGHVLRSFMDGCHG